jgi:phosphoribosylaminoimidazole-succinocarboxamide synthase
LKLVDFKMEFGKDKKGKIMLGDEITPDTCRLWDIKTNEKLDKDVFRFDLGDVNRAYAEVRTRVMAGANKNGS